jgi:UDP-glucose 4-epimerase
VGVSVLVTGGAGYIGSHTVRRLRELGHGVVVLDSLVTGHGAAVLDAPLIVGDIADVDLVRQVCGDHDVTACVHFAAFKNVGESMSHPERYWRNNVAGTAALVEGLAAAGVRRLVFSSSCSVYGTPTLVPVAEDASVAPESVYAESKAMAERLLAWQARTSGLASVSLRYFNAAGASHDALIGEDWTHSQNLIPVVMQAALGVRPEVQVFGGDYPTPDGTCIRDYIHVDDLAEAHVAALDLLSRHTDATDAGSWRAVNVGTGLGTSVLEVIRATEAVAQRPVPYRVVERRAGDPVAVWADPTGARALLGWKARHDLTTIIETAWRWHSRTL